MPTFYKLMQDGTVESVELPASEQARALNSGYSLTNPKPPEYKVDKATPDIVNNDYFNNLLDITEKQFSQQRGAVEQNYNSLVDSLKQSKELFNAGMEQDYGKALENLNIDVYSRGVQEGGIKGRELTDLGQNKDNQVKSHDLLDTQKQLIASQDRQQKLDELALSESKSKLSIARQASSPYAKYSYETA